MENSLATCGTAIAKVPSGNISPSIWMCPILTEVTTAFVVELLLAMMPVV